MVVWRPRHVGGVEMVRGIDTPHSAPRHFHEELEVGLRQGGGWEFHHCGAWHAVSPGTIVLTPPGSVHMVRAPRGAADTVYYGFRLDVDLLQRAATGLAGRPRHAPDFATPLVHDREALLLLLRLVSALGEGSAASPLEQESRLQDALGHLIVRHGAALGEGSAASPLEQESRLQDALGHLIVRHGAARLALAPQPAGAERGAVRRAREYIEEHAERAVTLAELARVADLIASHLCWAFAAAVGMPPHAYQTQVRVARAKALLVAGRLPLAQVAREAGFANQSHLTRHFARLVGVTPGRYVRESR